MLPVAPGRVDNWVESGDGESRIEWDTEKANWGKKNKKPTSHYWMVYFFPLHSSFCHAALNHLCSWKDLPWPPIFSPSLHGRITVPRLPQSFSLTQLLPHPYSSRMSLSLWHPLSNCVTNSMALIHQLVLRADNGLCPISKEKERHRYSDWKRNKDWKSGWEKEWEFFLLSIQWKEHDGKMLLRSQG